VASLKNDFTKNEYSPIRGYLKMQIFRGPKKLPFIRDLKKRYLGDRKFSGSQKISFKRRHVKTLFSVPEKSLV
jgi:hypothetical protein